MPKTPAERKRARHEYYQAHRPLNVKPRAAYRPRNGHPGAQSFEPDESPASFSLTVSAVKAVIRRPKMLKVPFPPDEFDRIHQLVIDAKRRDTGPIWNSMPELVLQAVREFIERQAGTGSPEVDEYVRYLRVKRQVDRMAMYQDEATTLFRMTRTTLRGLVKIGNLVAAQAHYSTMAQNIARLENPYRQEILNQLAKAFPGLQTAWEKDQTADEKASRPELVADPQWMAQYAGVMQAYGAAQAEDPDNPESLTSFLFRTGRRLPNIDDMFGQIPDKNSHIA